MTGARRRGLAGPAVIALVALAGVAAPGGGPPPGASAAIRIGASFVVDSRGAIHYGAATSSGGPLELETTRVERGGVSLAAARRPSRAGDGVTIDRGGVLERVRPTADGVEQSWEFRSAPAGVGPLEVIVSLRGAAETRRERVGASLRAGDAALRYGEATWIGADGARAPVALRAEPDRLVLSVDERTLATTRFPAVLDPVISPEISFDTPALGPAGGTDPQIAFDGVNYLAVWVDRTVRGARIEAASGKLLDPTGFVIAQDLGPGDIVTNEQPSVAFDGTNFFVVWSTSRRPRPNAGALATDIHATRVTPAGKILDLSPAPIVVDAAPVGVKDVSPSVAFDGTNHVVVFARVPAGASGGKASIHVARVSKAGAQVGVPALATASGLDAVFARTGWRVPIACDGAGGCLIAWSMRDHRSVMSARFASGVVSDPDGVPVMGSRADDDPVLAYGSGNYYLQWHDVLPTGSNRYAINAAIVSSDNVAGAPFRVDAASTVFTAEQRHAAAFDGTAFRSLWIGGTAGTHGPDLYSTTVSTTGVPSAPMLLHAGAMGTTPAEPTVACGATCYALWNANDRTGTSSESHNRLLGTRVAADGTKLDSPPVAVIRGANAQTAPSVGFDGANVMVAWREQDGAHLSKVKPGATTPLGPSITLPGVSLRILAFDGQSYLAALRATSPPYAQAYGWLTKDGALLDAAGTTVPSTPVAACAESSCLLAFTDAGGLVGFRVDASGAKLDSSPIRIAPGALSAAPSVAFDGTNYLVAWADASHNANLTIISQAGAILVPSRPVSTTPSEYKSEFRIASSPTESIVLWNDWRLGNGHYAVYGTRLTPSGDALDRDGVPIAVGTFTHNIGDLVFSPSRGAYAYVGWDQNTDSFDVSTTTLKVSSSGLQVSPTRDAVAASLDSETAARAVGVGVGYAVAYVRLDESPGFNADRVRLRFVGLEEEDAGAGSSSSSSGGASVGADGSVTPDSGRGGEGCSGCNATGRSSDLFVVLGSGGLVALLIRRRRRPTQAGAAPKARDPDDAAIGRSWGPSVAPPEGPRLKARAFLDFVATRFGELCTPGRKGGFAHGADPQRNLAGVASSVGYERTRIPTRAPPPRGRRRNLRGDPPRGELGAGGDQPEGERARQRRGRG